jgi:hypothetical protein
MTKLQELSKLFSTKYASVKESQELAFIAYKLAKRLFDDGLDDAATHALQCGETVLKREFGRLYGQNFFNHIRREILNSGQLSVDEFNQIINAAKIIGNTESDA